jgi:hypothetical protein
MLAAELAITLSQAWWNPHAGDLARLRAARTAKGLPEPDWKTIKGSCRVEAKAKEEHAASLDHVRHMWRQRVDSAGRGVWSAAADAAVDRVIKEVLVGVYEGVAHNFNIMTVSSSSLHHVHGWCCTVTITCILSNFAALARPWELLHVYINDLPTPVPYMIPLVDMCIGYKAHYH